MNLPTIAAVCLLTLTSVQTHVPQLITVDSDALNLPPALIACYNRYAEAVWRYDDKALRALLTPDFTVTDHSEAVSHKRSLKDMQFVLDMGWDFPGYRLTLQKAWVKPDRATCMVEEQLSGAGTVLHLPHSFPNVGPMTVKYEWVQRWVKTSQGWRLVNVAN